MAKSVAHMMLYKNNGRLMDRKSDLKKQCQRRLSNLRFDSFSKNRPGLLETEVNKIIISAVSEDPGLSLDEQIQLSEELFKELLHEAQEQAREYEQYLQSREEEEIKWMEECIPIPCPRCRDNNSYLTFNTNSASCGQCSLSFTHTHPSPLSLFNAIESIEFLHKDQCPSSLIPHIISSLSLSCEHCQFTRSIQ